MENRSVDQGPRSATASSAPPKPKIHLTFNERTRPTWLFICAFVAFLGVILGVAGTAAATNQNRRSADGPSIIVYQAQWWALVFEIILGIALLTCWLTKTLSAVEKAFAFFGVIGMYGVMRAAYEGLINTYTKPHSSSHATYAAGFVIIAIVNWIIVLIVDVRPNLVEVKKPTTEA
jgi:uncharacterized membrane protein